VPTVRWCTGDACCCSFLACGPPSRAPTAAAPGVGPVVEVGRRVCVCVWGGGGFPLQPTSSTTHIRPPHPHPVLNDPPCSLHRLLSGAVKPVALALELTPVEQVARGCSPMAMVRSLAPCYAAESPFGQGGAGSDVGAGVGLAACGCRRGCGCGDGRLRGCRRGTSCGCGCGCGCGSLSVQATQWAGLVPHLFSPLSTQPLPPPHPSR
jgi:hypothetical protein